MSQDWSARLRRAHHSLPTEKTVSGAEGSEDVPVVVSQPGHLLRECGEPHPARYRRGRSAGMVCGPRRIHAARRTDHNRRSALAPARREKGAAQRLAPAARWPWTTPRASAIIESGELPLLLTQLARRTDEHVPNPAGIGPVLSRHSRVGAPLGTRGF